MKEIKESRVVFLHALEVIHLVISDEITLNEIPGFLLLEDIRKEQLEIKTHSHNRVVYFPFKEGSKELGLLIVPKQKLEEIKNIFNLCEIAAQEGRAWQEKEPIETFFDRNLKKDDTISPTKWVNAQMGKSPVLVA